LGEISIVSPPSLFVDNFWLADNPFIIVSLSCDALQSGYNAR